MVGEAEDITRILQTPVGDALVVVPEGTRHRRHFRLPERDFGRWLHPRKRGGEGNDVLRRPGLIVADVEDAARLAPRQVIERAGNVGHMDAVEQLARLDDAPRRSAHEVDERVAAGAIDAGEPQDRDGHARFPAGGEPALLGFDTGDRAPRHRPAFALLIHPGAVMVAVDTDGGEIANPAQRRHGGGDRPWKQRKQRVDGTPFATLRVIPRGRRKIRGGGRPCLLILPREAGKRDRRRRWRGRHRRGRCNEMRCLPQSAGHVLADRGPVEGKRFDADGTKRFEFLRIARGADDARGILRRKPRIGACRIAGAEQEDAHRHAGCLSAISATAVRHSSATVSSLSEMERAAANTPKSLVSSSRDSAQTAAPRTSGDGSSSRASQAATSEPWPDWPAAISALRTNRSRPIRFTGEPEKKARKAASLSVSRKESLGARSSSRATSFASLAVRANLFHGQTARQSSQP